MAAIYGSCWGSNAGRYTVWIDWNLLSQDINNNTSTINAKLYVRRNDGYANSAYNLNGRQYRCLKYDNANVVSGNGNVDTRNGQSYLLQEANYTIWHNADGTKGITLQGEFNISGVSGLSGGSVSGWITLPTIQRASHPSVNNFTIGDLITINTNRTWNGFTHTIELIINGQTIRTLEHVDTSATVQLTYEEIEQVYNSMPTQQSCTVEVKCTTYNGSTNIGTNSAYSTCSIRKEECYPLFPSNFTLNYTYWENDSLYPFTCLHQILDKNVILSGFGQLQTIHSRVESSLSKNGAYIKKFRINFNGNITEYEYEKTENDYPFFDYYIDVPSGLSSSIDLIFTVVDSRGLETSKGYKLEVSDYVLPQINSVELKRTDGISEEVHLNLKASIWNGKWKNNELGELKNEIRQLQFRYYHENAESDEPYVWSEWINIPNDVIVIDENNQISVNDWLMSIVEEGPPEETVAVKFPVNDDVQVQFRLTDGIYRVDAFVDEYSGETGNLDISLGTYNFNSSVDPGKFLDVISKDYDGNYHIGIGGMPDDDYLETFHGDVNIKGSLNIESQSERGLIKEYVLDSEQSDIEIEGLDILKDGGLYKVEFTFSCTSNDDVETQINGFNSGYYFFAFATRSGSSVDVDGDMKSAYRANLNAIYYWTHGTPYSDYPSFMTIDLRLLKQVDNPNSYKMNYRVGYNSSSSGDNGISIIQGSNTETVENITSIKFHIGNNGKFHKGTRVKIYSR